MKFTYGKSWEKYPIRDNETWKDRQAGSYMTACDIIKTLPVHMLAADMIYSDPPWSLGNVNCFITKAGGKDYLDDYEEFTGAFFARITEIAPAVCYVEIGKQNLQIFKNKMSEMFPIVQEWQTVYYRKNICFLLRGGADRQKYDFTGMDDSKIPEAAISVEGSLCVADLCTGQGLTAVAAYRLGRRFAGTELNRRRLAVAIERVNKLGGRYEGPVS